MSNDSAGRDELLEIAAEIEEYADAPAQLLNIAAKVRRLALSRQAAQGGEAVAEIDDDIFHHLFVEIYPKFTNLPVGTKLYAAPPATAARVPEGLAAAVVLLRSAAGTVNNMLCRDAEENGRVIRKEAADELMARLGAVMDIIAAPASPAADERVQWLLPDDLEQLIRFYGYVSDPDCGGYMNSKDAVKRLAELGCVKWCGGSRHEVTRFGEWIVETNATKTQAELPLITCADFNARSHQEMTERNAALAARKADAPTHPYKLCGCDFPFCAGGCGIPADGNKHSADHCHRHGGYGFAADCLGCKADGNGGEE